VVEEKPLNEKTLKQDEIDALFEAARSSRPEATRTEVRARVVPYNFSSAGQISTEQLRAISMLNDLFARNLTHNLSAWLRTRFQVNLVSAEQIQFNDFLLRIPEISYVVSVRLEPLGALSVMQLDLGLAPPMIDLLLGGEGHAGPLRELTDIEESILGSVVEIICRELTAAWQPVGLSFNFERRQMQTQVARVISVNEKTLCLSFEIRMPHSSGLLNLAFPAVVANTILRRLTSDWSRRRHHAGDTRARMEAQARRILFGCSLQLPTVRLAAKALESLEPGDVLRLGLPASALPVLRVGGQTLMQAQAVRQGPHRAARIEHQIAVSELTGTRNSVPAMSGSGAVEQELREWNR
jgi:flagellar motor switch protein FliM